jgi:hypothetical protein
MQGKKRRLSLAQATMRVVIGAFLFLDFALAFFVAMKLFHHA